MNIYGILAHPAGQSLSPAMHNAGFNKLKLDAEYKYFDIEPEGLEDFIQKVRDEGIKGLSVSKPHKETIIELLDIVDDKAHAIGAVNTVFNRNEELHGTNVDWIGVQEAIKEVSSIEGKRCLILGAGGASRAAVFALQKANAAKVVILNRTVSHAQELAEEFDCEYGSLEDFAKHEPEIVIQATSAGMNKSEGVEIIPGKLLKENMVVMEMIYSPLMTKILRDAKDAGANIITGDRMLLHQGFAAFEIWTGQKAPRDVMEKAVHDHLN
jgi:shikimate dehydrogenase